VTNESVPLVPREVLFGNPERTSPSLSPDGERLAWIAPDEGVLNVWLGTITPEGVTDQRVMTHDRDRGIRGAMWAHDNRHLLYVQDAGGDENWRLHDIDLETGESRDLTPFEGVQARVEEASKHVPGRILVGLNQANPQLHDLYSLDLTTGELEKIEDNPGFVSFLADTELRVRGGVAATPDGGIAVVVRDSDGGEWRPLLEAGLEDALTTDPLAFTRDGTGLLAISSVDANAGRLVKIALATGEVTVIAEDDQYDVAWAHVHPDTLEPQLAVFNKDRASFEVLDPAIAGDIDALRAIDPGDLGILGESDDDSTWLVSFTNDNGPVRYYVWHRPTQQSTFLFEHRPALTQYKLASMEPFSYKARDGLEIHGYLTFPPDEPREQLPTVLLVHGGPWVRTTWGLEPEAQWFANRGYLCVEVNYRGSTGYGKDFLNAGNREWGGKMQTDLIDAVDWAVDQGFADGDRVAIYGGSYGGYAALCGAAFTPTLFRCAVDIVGPSNLKTLVESVPPYWEPMIAQFHTRVGNPATDEEFMWERSPLSRADAIRIPMLIAQGANDPRVKQAESEQIVAALQEHDIDHDYMLFEDEGHGFVKPENRLRFYAAAERFLARHLGGRFEE